jgi:predicted  nucleic acid-binding Zn-ribbon protein
MEKKCDYNKIDQIKALEIENGAFIAQISKLSHELTDLNTEVEKLSIENESLQKSSKSFEQKIIVLSQNLERKTNECEIFKKYLNKKRGLEAKCEHVKNERKGDL